MSGASIASSRPLNTVQQLASHANLSKDVSGSPAPPLRSTRGRLDAVIVPASRPAVHLKPLIKLATILSVPLVILCSKEARADHVAELVARTQSARSLIVQMPETWRHPGLPTSTSAAEFQQASAHRGSGLSGKRNLGLLLARLHGWNKIAFVDDDIEVSRPDHIARLAGQLDEHQVVGMVVREFPDNSVVCHARRLARFSQDVFVTGAVLGIHCNSLPLSFFPDIYNEDWFFFAEKAAGRRLPSVGSATQAEYDPFQSPDRARREEFGDLLAEGLYALIGEGSPGMPLDEQLEAATTTYWSHFIEARSKVLGDTMAVINTFVDKDPADHRASAALASLSAAASQLETITAEVCENFLHAWRADLADWQRFCSSVNIVGSTNEALDFLSLNTWTQVGLGTALFSSHRMRSRFRRW
jgi:hypothetical protein